MPFGLALKRGPPSLGKPWRTALHRREEWSIGWMSLRVVVNLHYFKFKVYQQNSCSPFVVVFHCYTESASPFCWLKTSYATCSHNRHGLMCLCSLAVALVPGWSTSCLPLWLQALYIVIPVELCYWCWKLKIVIKGLLHHSLIFYWFFPPKHLFAAVEQMEFL